MRLKTIHAPTLQAALDLVRRQMGPDAIIVATHEEDGARGARVTAAVEAPANEDFVPPPLGPSDDVLERLTSVLERHGLHPPAIDRILRVARDDAAEAEEEALSAGLAGTYGFDPFPTGINRRPILLIGPPGTGKTTVAAKLAARAALAGAPVTLISADPLRLGASEQLRLYAEAVGAEFHAVRDAGGLTGALAQTRRDRLVVIDTPGVNPYALEELALIIGYGHVGPMDVALVLGAARDAEEAGDVARAFRPASPRRLIATGLDIARRMGAVLAAAEAADLALAEYSPVPVLADGLKNLTAASLAALLLARVPGSGAVAGKEHGV